MRFSSFHALLVGATMLCGAGGAQAACTVVLALPPGGAVVSQSPQLSWTSDCVSWRVQYSPSGTFGGDRVQSPIRAVLRYRMPEEMWDGYLAGAWADGVWWRVAGTAEDGTRTLSAQRRLGVDPDLDDDGHSQGGGDCDDNDPAIHPGAEEACDGIDQDCDGEADEGFDEDGDTYTWCGGDCDDLDAMVHPGAEEVCDGIDQDCDGEVDEGPDADGDGVSLCAGDCDDGDPTVYPGAIEFCEDGVDQDCDGEDPACGGAGGNYTLSDAQASITLPNPFNDYDAGEDIDGDGIEDLVVGDYYANLGGGSYSGAVYIFCGPLSGALTPSDADYRLAGVAANDYAGTTVRFAGDVNADGYMDLMVGATGVDNMGVGGIGAVYVVHGPITADLSLATAAARLLGESTNNAAGAVISPAGDTNGDGYDDLLVGSQNFTYDGLSYRGSVYLVTGPPSGDLFLSFIGNRLMGEAASDRAPSSLAPLGDTDGDGFDDFAVGVYGRSNNGLYSNGAAYLFRGPIAGYTTLGTADAILSGDAHAANLGYSVGPVADQDDDGLPDWAVSAPGANTYDGRFYVLSGTLLGAAGPASALGTLDYGAMGDWDYAYDLEVAPTAGDADGDGQADLLFAWSVDGSIEPKVGVIFSPATGAWDVDAADALFVRDGPYVYSMDKPRWIDADMDGTDDVALYAYDSAYRIHVFDGP